MDPVTQNGEVSPNNTNVPVRRQKLIFASIQALQNLNRLSNLAAAVPIDFQKPAV